MERATLHFGNTKIHFRIERGQQRKTLAIRVTPAAEVLVKAPSNMSLAQVESLTRKKAAWIIQRIRGSGHRMPHARKIEFLSGESFSYLGRHYLLKVRKSSTCHRPYCKMRSRYLVCTVHPQLNVEETRGAVRVALTEWFRKRAEHWIPERVKFYENRLGVQVANVLVRDQQKRWASCDRYANLRFNWRVMMAPIVLVDYVIAHELCHFKVKDHSAKFWKNLRIVMPDYEFRKQRLASNGILYDF